MQLRLLLLIGLLTSWHSHASSFIGRSVSSGESSVQFQTDNYQQVADQNLGQEIDKCIAPSAQEGLGPEFQSADAFYQAFGVSHEECAIALVTLYGGGGGSPGSTPGGDGEESSSECAPDDFTCLYGELLSDADLDPDADPIAVSNTFEELNSVNSNNQNAAQLCASLVKLSIGNQGNCANYLSITQGQTLNVAELRAAIQLADALELLSAPSIDNLIRSKLGNSVDPQEIHDVCVASGLVPFEPENSRACAVIYLLSQGIYDRSLLLELPCIGEINYPELLDEWFEEQLANGGIPDYDAICAFALASQRPDRVPPELVVSAVDVTVFANDLPGRPLVRITATDARSDVTLAVTENEYLDLVLGEDGQATLVVRQPAFSQTEKLFLALGATDMAGNVTSLDIGLAVNLGERPATGLEDYPELTFVHWEGAIGAQALPNLFLDAGWSAQFVGPQGSELPTSLRPQGNTLAWTGAPAPTEFWIQVTNADDQVADTLAVQLQVEADADAVDVRAVPAPLAGVSLDAQAWQDFCVNNGLTEKGNTYSLPFIPSDQLDAFMAQVTVPPSLDSPDAPAPSVQGTQCPAGPVSESAVIAAFTVGDQIAVKVGDQTRMIESPALTGLQTHLAIDGCDAPRIKLAGAACVLDRSAPWR